MFKRILILILLSSPLLADSLGDFYGRYAAARRLAADPWASIQLFSGSLTNSTYTRGPSMAAEGDPAFVGGVLLPSGKVILVAYVADYVGILTPDPLLTVPSNVAESEYLNKL